MWKIRNSRRGTFTYICYFTFYSREKPGASPFPGNFDPGGIFRRDFFRWNFDPGWIFRRDLHVFGVKFYAVPAFNQVNGQFAGVLLLRDKQTVDLDWGSMIALEKLARQCFTAR